MKTHSGWTYEPAATTEHGVPTAFTWTSPTGARFQVDPLRLHPTTGPLTTPPHTPPPGGVIGALSPDAARSVTPTLPGQAAGTRLSPSACGQKTL